MLERYGLILAIIAATPIVFGVAVALVALTCSFIFWLIETLMTKIYNIKHPCPFCHNPSEPAIYLSEGQELPVKLRPGVYGLFHITHPVTGEKMPTMLLNGRDNLSRRCPHCNRLISYHTGIEKHVAFVGVPESGKTCLTYRFIGNLMKHYPDIRFTDEVSNEARRIITDIKDGKIQELASKTSVNDIRRSLQILIPRNSSLPYHFFINDVGGELFTTSGVEQTSLQFLKNIDSISVLIDPLIMDFSEYNVGEEYKNWYENFVNEYQEYNAVRKTTKVSDVINIVKTMAQQFVRKTKQIHMNIVLVKVDAGYISYDAINDENQIRNFVENQLGLVAEVSDMENTYASLGFYAVSALMDFGIDKFTHGIMNELKVKLNRGN